LKRTHVNFIIDTIGLVALVLMTTTGWLMRFILPPGSGSGRVIWGMDRHQWGYIHTWLAAAFIAAMVIHLILHWSWIVCMVRGEPGERRPLRGIVAAVSLLIALIVGVASLVTPVQVVTGRPDHEEHEEHGELRDGSGQGQGRGYSGGQ